MNIDSQSSSPFHYKATYFMFALIVIVFGAQAWEWIGLHRFNLSQLILAFGLLALSLTNIFAKVKSRSYRTGFAIALLLMLASCIAMVLDIRSTLGR